MCICVYMYICLGILTSVHVWMYTGTSISFVSLEDPDKYSVY